MIGSIARARGTINVSRHAAATARFDEPVIGVSGSSVLLRDTVTGLVVPATVTYDASLNEAARRDRQHARARARLPASRSRSAIARHHRPRRRRHVVDVHDRYLGVQRQHRLAVRVRHRLAGREPASPPAAARRPSALARRSRASRWPASCRVRSTWPSATRDFFTDDESSPHEADINRLAASAITGGCGGTPSAPLTGHPRADGELPGSCASPAGDDDATSSPMTRAARTRPTSTGSRPPASPAAVAAAASARASPSRASRWPHSCTVRSPTD